ncbi:hypothetical protein H2200_002754 [Cladophialophora chaetospira]|uniref:NAD(P)-binding domain-containing protein n=1 Tax=Cladophialophora chaetospira TaxID=386627 RepID=A0AA39CNC8_9EURO|nr:hypothetical protein H2200_002754 [Cladophialophora chaetospira]
MASPSFLITAASGHIGQELLPLLLAHPLKPKLVLPTSNVARLTSQLPPSYDTKRVHVIEGSLNDPNFVERICVEHSVTAVFLCLTTESELVVTLNFLDALKRAKCVKHLVYLSACGDFSLRAIENGVLNAVSAGHVVVKFIIEAKLAHGLASPEAGGMTWTIIGPSLFFINDFRSRKSILEKGVFDEPIGSKGVSRVHPVDIALAVSKALVDGGKNYHGQKIMIGSHKTYTSEETGRLWSEKLGREVKVVGSDEKTLSGFEAHISRISNPGWGRDMRLMYEIFEEVGFGMSEEDYKRQVEFLGKQPEEYEAWVTNVASKWKESI